jgi:hypothetical protein
MWSSGSPTAALLDMSEAAVKQRFARTLRELRGRLDGMEPKGAAGYAI